jgi:hypothetical protein
MNVNEYNNKCRIDEKHLIEILKKFLNQLKSMPNLFASSTSKNVAYKNHEINKDDEVIYNKTVKQLLKTMNSVAKILSEDPLFKEEELHDFMTIKRITEYILTKKKRIKN